LKAFPAVPCKLECRFQSRQPPQIGKFCYGRAGSLIGGERKSKPGFGNILHSNGHAPSQTVEVKVMLGVAGFH
jgi:hypothetical protein